MEAITRLPPVSVEIHNRRLLKEFLLEIKDPNTTPEKALQLLTYSCFSPTACFSPGSYITEDNDLVVIFLAFIMFIMKRLPDASVKDIWENILRMSFLYTQHFSKTLNLHECHGIVRLSVRVSTWLNKALSTHKNCPNPYIRLELFRLIRIFCQGTRDTLYLVWESICTTFIHTISEIQPLCFYKSGDVDDVLFGIYDLNYIISECLKHGKLQKNISTDISKQLDKKNEVFSYSVEARFVSHCIKLIGVFAIIAGSNSDPKKYVTEIEDCCFLFIETIGCWLINCGDHLPGMSRRRQFVYVVSRPPFCSDVVETIRDLTAGIINNKWRDIKMTNSLLHLRDIFALNLDVCTKTCDLPSLLLSHQLQGHTVVRQHSLLLKRLKFPYEKYYENRHAFNSLSAYQLQQQY